MFAKGLLGYLPANLLQGVIGFVALTVLTRVLTPTEYGCYVLALGVSSIAWTVVFNWLEAAMARFYPAERRVDPEAPVLYGTVYRAFAAIAVLYAAAVAAFALAFPAAWIGGAPLRGAIVVGLTGIVARSLAKLVQEQRRAEGRVGPAAVIDMLVSGGGFALSLVFVLAGLRSGGPLLGPAVVALLVLPIFAREDWGRALRGRFDAAAARAYAHYGYPISLSLIMTIGLYTVDRFMIARFLTEADAGAYHAAFSIASRVIDVLFIWFGTAGVPAMNHALETGGADALQAEARRQLKLMALVLFPATAGLICVAAPLSNIVIGPALRGPALAVTPLVTIGALLAGLNNGYFLLPFTLAKRTRRLIVAMSVPAALNIVLNVVLIPRFGLVGAAAAYAGSFLVGIVTSWVLSAGVGRLPLPGFELATIAGAAAVMVIVVRLLPSLGTGPDLVLRPLTGVAVYGAIAWLTDLGGVRALLGARLSRWRPQPVFGRSAG